MDAKEFPERTTRLRWSCATDRGRVRANNEDSFLGLRFDGAETERLGRFGDSPTARHDFVFAVSDGMGGALAGEYASRIAVEKITTLLPRTFSMGAAGMDAGHADLLNELFSRVHRALRLLGGSYDECRGMETTLSLCWFSPGRMHFGHIGDSRIYLLPGDGGALRRLTHDDTHVDWLFRTGKINEREARSHPGRHVLQRALGGGNQFVEPQVGSVAHAPGDLFLICSDGLTDGLHERALEDHLRLPWGEAVEGASITARLISEALASGSRDNVTAVAIRMESA